jgi:hypothetical protein
VIVFPFAFVDFPIAFFTNLTSLVIENSVTGIVFELNSLVAIIVPALVSKNLKSPASLP